MIHGKKDRKLNRSAPHRRALLRNMSRELILNERIKTTQAKAKHLQPYVEKLVTRAEEDTVHNRRQARRKVEDDDAIAKLFEELGPRFEDRPGGYTRILKLDRRKGDGSQRALIEFVE